MISAEHPPSRFIVCPSASEPSRSKGFLNTYSAARTSSATWLEFLGRLPIIGYTRALEWSHAVGRVNEPTIISRIYP